MGTINRRDLIMVTGAAAVLVKLPRMALAATPDGPPVARIESVTETFFGTSVTDPYRWMENPQDKDWEPYMRGQAAYTRRVLDAIPGRTAMAKRVAALSGDLEVVN